MGSVLSDERTACDSKWALDLYVVRRDVDA